MVRFNVTKKQTAPIDGQKPGTSGLRKKVPSLTFCFRFFRILVYGLPIALRSVSNSIGTLFLFTLFSSMWIRLVTADLLWFSFHLICWSCIDCQCRTLFFNFLANLQNLIFLRVYSLLEIFVVAYLCLLFLWVVWWYEVEYLLSFVSWMRVSSSWFPFSCSAGDLAWYVTRCFVLSSCGRNWPVFFLIVFIFLFLRIHYRAVLYSHFSS